MDLETQTKLLKQFVELCKKNPSILYQPNFAFYREYLESLGAKLPPPTSKGDTSSPEDRNASHDKTEEYEEKEEELPELELDMSGVIESEKDEPLPMGDPDKEPSEEDLEKASEYRNMAVSAFSEGLCLAVYVDVTSGDFNKAVENYTEAIKLNPKSAMIYAKRASALLKLNKPSGAIRDCDKALALNPDSAAAYKFRGRANRLLGKFLEAYQDLATACKLDYDDTANEWMKEVEPNVS
uniref:TPR_REGION domain-containing protein n=1 Tax=Syphacia muris TaxID=451379 RepID=A0A0N5A8B5_9BILA